MTTATTTSPVRELLVTAAGDLDLHTVGRLETDLATACARGPVLVVLDLRAVDFVDCAALGAVLRAREDVRRDGGELVVRGASRCSRRLLVLTGLTDLLEEDGPG